MMYKEISVDIIQTIEDGINSDIEQIEDAIGLLKNKSNSVCFLDYQIMGLRRLIESMRRLYEKQSEKSAARDKLRGYNVKDSEKKLYSIYTPSDEEGKVEIITLDFEEVYVSEGESSIRYVGNTGEIIDCQVEDGKVVLPISFAFTLEGAYQKAKRIQLERANKAERTLRALREHEEISEIFLGSCDVYTTRE